MARYNFYVAILSSIFTIYLVIVELDKVECRTLTATESLLKTEVVEYFTNNYVEPFDADTLLPPLKAEDKNCRDYPIGRIRLINAHAATSTLFSVSFNIYSRDDFMVDIKINPLFHRVHLKQPEGRDQVSIKPSAEKRETKFLFSNTNVNFTSFNTKIISARYEFNMTELTRPENPFKPDRRTVVIVPGYMSGSYVEWMHEIRAKWLELEDVNVIMIYWPEGNSLLYSQAVANTRLVSRQITIFLYYLAEINGIKFNDPKFRENLHFVGHSLGAHICAFVGQDLMGQVGRITALDPAGPDFDKQEPDLRLDQSDAIFVDVIHTNSGKMHLAKAGFGLLKKMARGFMSRLKGNKKYSLAISMLDSFHSEDDTAWFGIDRAVGHMDYYPNGGSIQPGCNDQLHICDHKRASTLYISALDYEIQSRISYGPESDIIKSGLYRLVAFPSQDYERFLEGLALMRNCPMLLTASNQDLSDEERFLAYKRCTVPLDFVSSGPKLKAELEQVYSIPLDDLNEERRYYFETLSQEPYLGEHYLMRIHIVNSKHLKWTRGCRLTSLVHSYDTNNLYSLINYRPTKLIPFISEDFHGISLPFASPVDWRIAHPTPDSIAEQLSIIEADPTIDYFSSLRYFIPGNISVGLTYTRESIFGGFSGLFNFKKQSKSSNCQFTISSIEIRPLTSVAYNISVWYVNDLEDTRAVPIRRKEELNYLKNLTEYQLELNNTNPYAMIFPTIITFMNHQENF